MKLITFMRSGGSAEPGVLVDNKVFAPRGAGFPDTIAVLAAGERGRAEVERFLVGATDAIPANEVTLVAPIPRPPKLICVGLNYRDHAAESKLEIPSVPTIFNKFPSI